MPTELQLERWKSEAPKAIYISTLVFTETPSGLVLRDDIARFCASLHGVQYVVSGQPLNNHTLCEYADALYDVIDKALQSITPEEKALEPYENYLQAPLQVCNENKIVKCFSLGEQNHFQLGYFKYLLLLLLVLLLLLFISTEFKMLLCLCFCFFYLSFS